MHESSPDDQGEDWLPAIFVQVSRVYDMLTVLAFTADKEYTQQVLDAHDKGEFFGPPPRMSATPFLEEDENDE